MELLRISPVFPVRRLGAAVAHYEKLGFAVRRFKGPDEYAFAMRGTVEIHLTEVARVRPGRNLTAVYLYVTDADALYAEWQAAAVTGRLVAPTDTDYGLREGAAVDGDGNLIRFGSRISE